MRSAIIGYTGLVGSNLLSTLKNKQELPLDLYNSSNIKTSENKEYDTVYISAIQAKKWWANQNPIVDKRIIDKLFAHLSMIKAKKVVFISTIDVYQPPIGADEYTVTSDNIHAYGANRLYAEKRINELFDDVHIVRLQGLIANNLSKNIVFDLKNKNMLESINPNSMLQWYPLSRLVSDIDIVIKNNIKLINLSVEPVSTQQIIDIAPLTESEKVLVSTCPSPTVKYDVTSQYAEHFGGQSGYIVKAEESLRSIENYFKY